MELVSAIGVELTCKIQITKLTSEDKWRTFMFSSMRKGHEGIKHFDGGESGSDCATNTIQILTYVEVDMECY